MRSSNMTCRRSKWIRKSSGYHAGEQRVRRIRNNDVCFAFSCTTNSCKVYIADRDTEGAAAVAESLNKVQASAPGGEKLVYSTTVSATDWDSQAEAFGKAVKQFGRVDYVYPIAGIGERVWTPNDPSATSGFVKPDLSVIEIDLTGVLYTVSLAIQQFRRQEVGSNGTRGKSIHFFPQDPLSLPPSRLLGHADLFFPLSRLHSKRVRLLLRPNAAHLYRSQTVSFSLCNNSFPPTPPPFFFLSISDQSRPQN